MATAVSAITRKSAAEIGLMHRAGRVLAACLEHLAAAVRPGITTRALDSLAEAFIRDHGCVPGFIDYQGYPDSLCVSINDEVVHGMPSARVLVDGDLVSLDCGLIRDGWWADSGLSVGVGACDDEVTRLLAVTAEALALGIAQARPGARIGDIGAAVQAHVEAGGFSVVRGYVGHGIGRDMHEAPQVPNYGRAGQGIELRSGYVLAIEPMVNAGGHDVVVAPDGWTVATADGRRSCYAEHTVAITDAAPLVLTAREGEDGGDSWSRAR